MYNDPIIIRRADEADMELVARTHSLCFDHGFTSSLHKFNYACFGGDLTAAFYLEYFIDFPELFIVAESNGTIVGFCMGYYLNKKDQLSRFIKRNVRRLILKIPVLLLTGDKPTWKKVYQVITRSQEKVDVIDPLPECVTPNGISDILSICVLPEYRGLNIASKLVNEFIETSRDRRCKVCLLTVEDDNIRAINFYKKMGFKVYSNKINKKGYKKML